MEWARIEPEEGRFDDAEVEHYRAVIRCCWEHGIKPIVTMHHFSSPKWLITKDGREAESSAQIGFSMESLLAARKAAAEESEQVFGLAPGAQAQTFLSLRTEQGDRLIMRAHEAARDAMKAVCPRLRGCQWFAACGQRRRTDPDEL